MPLIRTFESVTTGDGGTYPTVQSDELLNIPESFQQVLVDRELVYVTRFFLKNEVEARGTIIARDLEQAKNIAVERGLDEEVIGLVYEAD